MSLPSSLVIKKCDTARTLGLFCALPRLLYKGLRGYEPPLDLETQEMINPQKNPYFSHGEAVFFLAFRGEEIVGRISAQIDHLENSARTPSKIGHFGCLCAKDDLDVVKHLLKAAEDWLFAAGVSEITGPFSLSINMQSGLLVEGFEERAMVLIPWDPPYLGKHLEACGYHKVRDLYSYTFSNFEGPIPFIEKLLEKVSLQKNISVRLGNMKNLAKESLMIRDLFNQAWQNNWGFVPMTDGEITHMAQMLKPFMYDECLSVVEYDGKPVAFALVLGNLLELSQGLEGRLFPFGWARLLWRYLKKRYSSARVVMMGVDPDYQKTPLGGALALLAIDRLRPGARKYGVVEVELGWVLEENRATRRILELLGARLYKTHRVYQKVSLEPSRFI